MIYLPDYVKNTIKKIDEAGYSAYAVGGCIRDTLMGRDVSDYDICSSAKPEDIKEIFSDEKTLDTGIKHGTVTLVLPEGILEITTFRSDGVYVDGRRPENVDFVDNLEEDLKRRDFTVNAMAADAEGNLVDIFGGEEDLDIGIIRTVGDPEKRFEEDRLRILRGMRFASVLDFFIDFDTDEAIREFAADMAGVSAERVNQELKKLMTGKAAFRVLSEYSGSLQSILGQYLGRTAEMNHALVDGYKAIGTFGDYPMMMAIAFGTDGEEILKAIKASGDEQKECRSYSEIISFLEEGSRQLCLEDVRRLVYRYGMESVRKLSEGPFFYLKVYAEFIRENNLCCSLKELAVNGDDMRKLGIEGPDIRSTLEACLERVIRGDVENRKEDLLELASGTFAKG